MIKLLFSFEGRINRKPYWMVMLVAWAGFLIATTIDLHLSGKETGVVSIIFLLLFLWPALAIQVKRWHDTDRSGWWILIGIIPIIGQIWMLVENGIRPGTVGGNRFGDDPIRIET